jgi:hypothetical protein
MNKFGTANAGKEVTTAAFVAHCEHETGKPVGEFLKPWLEGKELPALTLDKIEQAFEARATASNKPAISVLTGEIRQTNGHGLLTIRVLAETDQGLTSAVVNVKDGKASFELRPVGIARRVYIAPCDASFCEAGGKYAINSFREELAKTLIVYGTLDEKANNLEAAQNLQEGIVVQGSNFTVPYKSDKEVTYDDLKEHHVILIGIPQTNAALWRGNVALKPNFEQSAKGEFGGTLSGFGGPIGGFGGSGSDTHPGASKKTSGKSAKPTSYTWQSIDFPVTFGPRSFDIKGRKFANAGSAVIAAGANPFNPRYSVVVIAGLNAESTYHAVPSLLSRGSATEVLVLPARAGSQNIVVTPSVYMKELTPATKVSRVSAGGGGK